MNLSMRWLSDFVKLEGVALVNIPKECLFPARK